jgi:putative two-component system response regulator
MSSRELERLDALLHSGGGANDLDFKVALTRLSRELKIRLNRSSSDSHEFFSSALRAVSRIKGTTHVDVRMTCIFNCFAYFYTSGHPASALEAAQHLRKMAEKGKSKSWLRKAYTSIGIVYADMGEISEAMMFYANALEISRDIKDLDAEGIVLNNLGTALSYAGLYTDALLCFERVANLSSSLPGTYPWAKKALTNCAQAYLHLEDFPRGLAAAAKASAALQEPDDAESMTSRVILEFTYVQLALYSGDLKNALEHCESCRHFSVIANSPRTGVLASIAAGLCEVHMGSAEEGLALLEGALARTSESQGGKVFCLKALVRSCDEAGQPEKALIYMNELLSHIRITRDASVAALMERSGSASNLLAIGQNTQDLRSLEQQHLKLRAAVAEREVEYGRLEILERLAITADMKEENSGEHGYRVGKFSYLLAERLNWTIEACDAIEHAARLHDIGKIGVPDRILLSSEELKQAERHFMGTHTVIGAELLGRSNIPQLRMAEDIARHHHEWWDGSGYPSKLVGKRIPIHARIVALADVFDALTHGRPYSDPWPMDRAIEEIRNRRGTQFDPELTDAFLELVGCLRAEHADLDAYLGKGARNSPFLQARNRIRAMVSQEQQNEQKATAAGNETRH